MEYPGIKETRLTRTEDEVEMGSVDSFSLQLHANYLSIYSEYVRVLDWTTGRLKLVSLMMLPLRIKLRICSVCTHIKRVHS